MNARIVGLMISMAGAMAALGVIIYVSFGGEGSNASPKQNRSADVMTTEAEDSMTTDDEAHGQKQRESVKEEKPPEILLESSLREDEHDNNDKHSFTVDILLAPYGYHVSEDYVLEIARAQDVHSTSVSHLDNSDNIFYSASVINGITKLYLENGEYEVCIYPEGEPENFKRYSWKIDDSTTDSDLKLIVTENIKPGQMMIVLHWGDRPRDIDGYFVGEGDFVHYWGRVGKHARLDIDERTGNGIEAITVTDPKGDFTYYVDDYSNEISLGQTNVVVEVFSWENKAPTIFRVPTGIKEVWEVFTMKDGVITESGKEGPVICPEKK